VAASVIAFMSNIVNKFSFGSKVERSDAHKQYNDPISLFISS
jgi:hypothetical protein